MSHPQPFKNRNAECLLSASLLYGILLGLQIHHHMTGKKTSVFQGFRKGTLLWVHVVLECLNKGVESRRRSRSSHQNQGTHLSVTDSDVQGETEIAQLPQVLKQYKY